MLLGWYDWYDFHWAICLYSRFSILYYEREREREKGNVTVRKCELAGTKEYDGTGKKEVRNGN